MTDLYSEQQTGMRFSAFPLLVPHKHVPGHSWAEARVRPCSQRAPREESSKREVASKGMGFPTKGPIPESCV